MDCNMEQSSRTKKNNDLIEPIRTLARSDCVISVGTLVWGKLEEYPWWPGLVVTHTDVGWPIKEKDSYCILWLGPNKTASWMAPDKLADFLDPNLSRLIYWQNGDDYEEAICEALKGVMGQQKIDTNISSQKLKSLAVITQFQREEINDRKQVVMDKTSTWYREGVKSLEASDKSLKIALYEKMESSKKRISIVRPSADSRASPMQSSSPLDQIGPAGDHSILFIGEEEAAPPKKKMKASSLPLAQSKQADNGTVAAVGLANKFHLDDKASVSPVPSRNVARKHTNPIMRTAHLKRMSAPEGSSKSFPVPSSSCEKKEPSYSTMANSLPEQNTSTKGIPKAVQK